MADPPIRLNAANLSRIGNRIAVPAYARAGVKPAIAHIGVGGFHRAHQAVYTDAVLAAGDAAWGIRGIGITANDARMAEVMKSQDCLYTVIARGIDAEEVRVVGSIVDYRLAGSDPASILAVLTDPETRIVSLTVTESGYAFRGDTGELDFDEAGIRHDVQNPHEPRSVIGVIAEALRIVSERNLRPPTFLSCDNLPHNGKRLRGLVASFVRETGTVSPAYVEEQVSFPSTMVDRITPATRDEDRRFVAEHHGVVDEWPVQCELFRQWVIEDAFSRGRPDWSVGGAQFVDDVTPYELMKIRLLNGTHSALSYTAYLMGYRNVDQATADPLLLRFVRTYMTEIVPTVGSVPGIDLDAYMTSLVERFSNQAISDKVSRLAMDGSRKIPNSIVAPLTELLERRVSCPCTAFALAAWIRYLRGTDETGAAIEIIDPHRDVLRRAAQESGRDARPFLSRKEVFPPGLAENGTFSGAVSRSLAAIEAEGTRAALEHLLGG